MPSALRDAYQRRLAAGDLVADPAQETGLAALVRLEGELANGNGGSLFRRRRPARGVYLFGPVGRGNLDQFVFQDRWGEPYKG